LPPNRRREGRPRLFNGVSEIDREALYVEVDASIISARLVRIFRAH
jgi:hypothetical protein